MIPVVLSGGSGTRLWPISRKQHPKQFCEIFEKPLQTLTIERSMLMGNPWVVTSKSLKTLTEKNLQENGFKNVQVVYEPLSKNTAPAIAVLCRLLQLRHLMDEVVSIFPADHLIQDQVQFNNVVQFASQTAQQGRVVTLGVLPAYAETGYGYIQVGPHVLDQADRLQAYDVVKFHEKPEPAKAKSFVEHGAFYWNSGIFVFKVQLMIDLFKKYQPQMWSELQSLAEDLSNIEEIYEKLQNISIDFAIMEKLSTDELACIPADFGWSDVGSWDAVSALTSGQEILNFKAKENFVFGEKKKKYSVIGIDDVIIVDTKDALMLVKKGQSQDVKKVVDKIASTKTSILDDHTFEFRPWGYFEILKESKHFKTKVIRLNPYSQISYQSHDHRAEHWTITEGLGEVVLNDQILPVMAGSHIFIPAKAKHRIRNTSSQPLEFVEVQLGSYFGEDDITRYQDDYQRERR